jgi:hypothetical protein
MGSQTRTRLAAPILVCLAAFVPTAAGAGLLEGAKTPKPVVATTGDDSELLRAVPIARKPGKRDRVAMRIAPSDLDPIRQGDRLRVSGEVQVSTTCVESGSRCVGTHYQVNPTVTARIVLSPSPSADSGFFPLSPSRSVLCKQQRPNRNHHCTIAIPNTETAISDVGALPCPPDKCFVELIVGASNKKAKRGNMIVLGGDKPDGSVEQDKGRLNIVQAHRDVPAPKVTSTSDLVSSSLPLGVGDSDKEQVVYSMPIKAAQKGEVLAFDTRFTANIGALHYNNFIASQVILAQHPDVARTRGIAKRADPLKGKATEVNGFNCTLGQSGYPSPCTSVKAGVVRFKRDVVDKDTGEPATIYLNVLAAAKPKLAEKVEPGDKVAVGALPDGLTVTRYGSSSGGVTAP